MHVERFGAVQLHIPAASYLNMVPSDPSPYHGKRTLLNPQTFSCRPAFRRSKTFK